MEEPPTGAESIALQGSERLKEAVTRALAGVESVTEPALVHGMIYTLPSAKDTAGLSATVTWRLLRRKSSAVFVLSTREYFILMEYSMSRVMLKVAPSPRPMPEMDIRPSSPTLTLPPVVGKIREVSLPMFSAGSCSPPCDVLHALVNFTVEEMAISPVFTLMSLVTEEENNAKVAPAITAAQSATVIKAITIAVLLLDFVILNTSLCLSKKLFSTFPPKVRAVYVGAEKLRCLPNGSGGKIMRQPVRKRPRCPVLPPCLP